MGEHRSASGTTLIYSAMPSAEEREALLSMLEPTWSMPRTTLERLIDMGFVRKRWDGIHVLTEDGERVVKQWARARERKDGAA